MGGGWAAFTSIMLLAVGLGLILSWGVTRLTQKSPISTDTSHSITESSTQILGDVLRFAGEFSQKLPEPLARLAPGSMEQPVQPAVCSSHRCRWCSKRASRIFSINGFTIISTYFLIKDRNNISEAFRRLLPEKTFMSSET